MEKIQFVPRFVNTRNVRNFAVLMDGLHTGKLGRGEGDERLGLVFGRAGRGKTRTVQTYAAHHNCVYLKTVVIWSELDFLKALCRKLGIRAPAGRRGRCFQDALDALINNPRTVFVDEIERFGWKFLEIVRDLAEITGGAFVLIGEEELPHLMKRNRRVWSRTYQQMEFKPIEAADIVVFVNDTTGLKINGKAMAVMHKASGGDWRIVRRDTINLVQVANARGVREIDEQMAKIAVKTGLRG